MIWAILIVGGYLALLVVGMLFNAIMILREPPEWYDEEEHTKVDTSDPAAVDEAYLAYARKYYEGIDDDQ